MKTSESSPNREFPKSIFVILSTISFLYYSLQLLLNYQRGGNEWKQGDWLINSENGPIRRSFTGDLFIWISDLTGANILVPVIATQILFALLLYVAIVRLIKFDKTNVLLLLALSISFFIFFWTANPQGSGRKEVIAFAAMALIALALRNKSVVLSIVGFLLFSISVLGHEAMILFLPALTAAYILCFNNLRNDTIIHVCFFVSSIASLIAFYFALTNSGSSNVSMICEPLIARGALPEICDGAIKFLENDMKYGMEAVLERVDPYVIFQLLIGYSLALAPAIYVATISSNKKLSFSIIVLSGLPFLPLYVFAVDFGRWVNFHIFSIFFLFAAAMSSKRITFDKPLGARVLILAFLVGALITYSHTRSLILGGAVSRVAGSVISVLN